MEAVSYYEPIIAQDIGFVEDDGGRKAAGYKGTTGDCVTRAIAIATGEPYAEVYTALHKDAKTDRAYMAALELKYGAQARRHASPRTGVNKRIYQRYLFERGWRWVPTMGIGTGCQVHLRAAELPSGRIICRLSKHVCAVINGVVHDIYDPSRAGTRCVYGYFIKDT